MVLSILASVVLGGSLDVMGAALVSAAFGAVTFVVYSVLQQIHPRPPPSRGSR
jgi:hypothetical protein